MIMMMMMKMTNISPVYVIISMAHQGELYTIAIVRDSAFGSFLFITWEISLQYLVTEFHTETLVCVCVCVCMYVYIYCGVPPKKLQ
jgi:hypothetical protein